MTDPKKTAADALLLLPPPDRLKRKRPTEMGDGSEEEDAGDSDEAAGALAMGDVRKALDSGDDAAAFAALERAVAHCSGGYAEGE